MRIGIHLVNTGCDIYPVPALAPPGGICISGGVYDEIRNKPDIATKDLGEQKLKNVSRPIRVYALVLDGAGVAPSATWISGRRDRAAVALAGVLALAAVVYVIARSRLLAPVATPQPAAPRQIRSIAVLPLDNFSGDPS